MKHTVRYVIDNGWPSVAIECPYEASNTERPCWPHTESGEPVPQAEAERDGCVYAEWMSEGGVETLHGETTLRFDLERATWHGDHFTFVLGDLRAASVVGGTPDAT